jgi:cytidine deaminase
MIEDQVLIAKAFEAQEKAYTPYSKFKVGAALLGKNGKIYLGCNIENAAFTPTNCAERTAFFKAVSEGQMTFDAIAIVGNMEGVEKGEGDYCAPCGVCRQVMAEFCDPKNFRILLAKSETDYKEFLLEELLPLGFTKNDMK